MLMILSRSLPDLNIVTNEEVDDAYTDDSDDCCALGTKQSSIPWDRLLSLRYLQTSWRLVKTVQTPSHMTSIGPYGLAAILKVS